MYRMFRNERKRKLKLLHAGIMITVFLLAVIALQVIVFQTVPYTVAIDCYGPLQTPVSVFFK